MTTMNLNKFIEQLILIKIELRNPNATILFWDGDRCLDKAYTLDHHYDKGIDFDSVVLPGKTGISLRLEKE